MSTIAEYRHEATGSAFTPYAGQRIRELVQHALDAFKSRPEDSVVPRVPQTRDEAMIEAARIALGGTISW